MAAVESSTVKVFFDIFLIVYVDTGIPILGLGIREKVSGEARLSTQSFHPTTFAQ
jgi:hypothetical protein